MGTKWLLTATAVAFIASTGFAAAQQSPLPPAPAEKVAPPTKDLNSPASPGVTGGAILVDTSHPSWRGNLVTI